MKRDRFHKERILTCKKVANIEVHSSYNYNSKESSKFHIASSSKMFLMAMTLLVGNLFTIWYSIYVHFLEVHVVITIGQ